MKNPTTRIRILQIGLHDQLGGVETFAHNYFTKLNSQLFQIDFVSIYPQLCFEQDFKNQGSKIYHLPSFKTHSISYAKQLYRILNQDTYDIIHIHMLSAANILPLIIAKHSNIPHVILHSHNNGTPRNPIRKFLHLLNKKYLRHADHFWACSQEAGNWLFSKKNHFDIIPNAINLSKFQPNQAIRRKTRNQLNVPDNEILIGHVGRFAEQKNHSYLIKIFYRLTQKDPNIKLLLIGDGKTKRHIIKQIKRLHLTDRVILLHPQLDIAKYYQAMDVFALPSKFEGLPIVGIEAQASKTPCIFSDKITPEIILTDHALRLPIKKGSIQKWVNTIMDFSVPEKSTSNQTLINYDLNYAVKHLEAQYLQIIHKEESYE